MNLETLKKSRLAYALRWGIAGLWMKHVGAKKILKSAPCRPLTDARCEIHSFTSAKDFLALMWALKSFYAASKSAFLLCVHDDGSLNHSHLALFLKHFPGSRFIWRKDADAHMAQILAPFPKLAAFRQSNVMGPKLTDFVYYAATEKMMFLDSDVLFFKYPTALMERLENPCETLCSFNRDISNILLFPADTLKQHCGFLPLEQINSGLSVLPRRALSFEKLEVFLNVPDLNQEHPWLIEQQLVSMCATQLGAEILPAEYDLIVGPCPKDKPVRHYFGGTCGGIRHLMYREGIPRLIKGGLA